LSANPFRRAIPERGYREHDAVEFDRGHGRCERKCVDPGVGGCGVADDGFFLLEPVEGVPFEPDGPATGPPPSASKTRAAPVLGGVPAVSEYIRDGPNCTFCG